MQRKTLSIDLGYGIVYVYGVVNGIETTWTNIVGTTRWRTNVPRSTDDVYHVTINAINRAGKIATVDTILYYGLHLIWDRTQEDVNLVLRLKKKKFDNMTESEKASWRSELKGGYNYSDMNRVEGAVEYLSERLAGIVDEMQSYAAKLYLDFDPVLVPYNPSDYEGLESKTDWINNLELEVERPTPEQGKRYLGNVQLVIRAFPANYPKLPTSLRNLTYQGANAIERALVLLYDAMYYYLANQQRYLDIMASEGIFSDDVFAGEVYCGARREYPNEVYAQSYSGEAFAGEYWED